MSSRLTLCGLSLLLIAACGSAAKPAEPPKRLEVAPNAVDFGWAAVGMRAHAQVAFSNPATIHRGLRLRIEGDFASEFSVAEAQTVAPGESAFVDVWFRPAGEGVRSAVLVYSAGEETGALALTGSGAHPRLQVAEALDFGATPGPASQTLTVENAAAPVPGTNAADLLLGFHRADGSWAPAAPTIEGENAAEFEVTWGAASANRVAPSASLDLEVKFVPSGVGARHATLRLRTNDAERPEVRVALTGELAGPVDCLLAVTPGTVSLSGPVGEPLSRTIAVRNEGATACRVTGVWFAPGSAAAFSVDRTAPFAIGAGRAVPLEVVFSPTQIGEAGGTLEIESGARRASVAVTGKALVPIAVSRPEIDFGVVPATCGSREAPITLRSVGASPWRIDYLQLIGGPEFALTQRPVLPAWTTQVGFDLTVRYLPRDAGDDTATLRIGGAGYSVDVPISGRGVLRPPQTDVFAGQPPLKVDVLFVIDDSPSMADQQQSVATNLAAWFDFLRRQYIDYHVAVTTTSIDAAHGGAGSGATFANGRLTPLDGSRPRVITPTVPNGAQLFAANAAVGAATPSEGFLLRPMTLALAEPLLSNENAGFLRDDAYLAIVLISDGADFDLAQRIDALATFVTELKGPRRANMVSFSAVVPTLATPPEGCSYDAPDAGSSSRVRDLVVRTGGIYEEICSPHWERRFEFYSPMSLGFRELRLSQRPDMRIKPEPITVEIDGVLYPEYGPLGDRRWRYDSTLNGIRFDPLAVPDVGSTVEVTYVPACG